MKVLIVQMVSGPNPKENLDQLRSILSGSSEAIDLILVPEMFACFGVKNQRHLAETEFREGGEFRQQLALLAKENHSYLIAGTLPVAEQCNQENKVRAASIVYSPEGQEVARYDKIHLFDVDVGDAQGRYRESDTFEAGSEIKVFPVNLKDRVVNVGLSVCYDLRFPELYQQLVKNGAEVIVVPSAFTEKTGKAHWQVLLKARAIETQCFVLASGQGGVHDEKRSTYGHSQVIDPWGEVITELHKGKGYCIADLDLTKLERYREAMPIQSHKKLI